METETWSEYVSEYRRFVSYLYEYRRGKKANNCGFVKVEIRNGVCRLRLHLQPSARSCGTLQVYGFVRRQEKQLGISLGIAGAKSNVYDFQVNSPTSAIGNSAYTIEDIRGIWLKGAEENYITVWDDEPVAVEQFTTDIEEDKLETKAAEAETAETTVEQKAVTPESKAESETDQAVTEPKAGQTAAGPETDQEAAEMGAGIVAVQEQSAQKAQISGASTRSLYNRWEQFLNHYPQIQPFADDEITQCICIAPKDLSFLQKEEWHFSKNTFLRQAYMQYHYLMLGCHKNGRFVLAVPGTCDSAQEKHMARMYGFPYFKETIFAQEEGGEMMAADDRNLTEPVGYWYHFLNEECPR